MKLLSEKRLFFYFWALIPHILWGQIQVCNNNLFVFPIKSNEQNCMRSFEKGAVGINYVNAYLLSKMTEMMYPERLDYQLRYLRNNSQPLTSIQNTKAIQANPIVTDANFECAFAKRFSHYFIDEVLRPKKPLVVINNPLANQNNPIGGNIGSTPNFGTIGVAGQVGTSSPTPPPTNLANFTADSTAWAKANSPEFKYIHKTSGVKVSMMGLSYKFGYDPELMVISTKDLVIIVYRGTDAFMDSEFGEWIGTDANAALANGTGPLAGTQLHKGFWESFLLIKNDLYAELNRVNAKNKTIWVTGHSLGAAMAVVTGTFLKADNFPVNAIYGFACPKSIGNAAFAQRANSLLPNRIQRFEFYLDPISLLWAPGYEPFGKRNWINLQQDNLGFNFTFFTDEPERYVSLNPCEFNKCPGDNRSLPTIKALKERKSGFFTDLDWKLYYHNPQYHVLAFNQKLTTAQRLILPATDNPYPFMYMRAPWEAIFPTGSR